MFPSPSVTISTHSLTKRLTAVVLICSILLLYFNSQPHEEADTVDGLISGQCIYFNSQPHEEADDDGGYHLS